MPNLIQNNFSSGEMSPRLYAREDVGKYANGVAELRNMTVFPQGPATRRMGTIFVNPAKFGDRRVRLIPFIFGREDAYVLEFGDLYMRVHRARGTVFNGGSEYEISTPFTESMLDEIAWTQTADTVYLTTPSLQGLRKLTRSNNTNWTLTNNNSIKGMRAITFYQQRLVLGGSNANPQRLQFSDINNFENFSGSGADQGFNFTLASDRVNTILWVVPNQRNLMIGTQGGIWTISPPNTANGLASDNIEARRASQIGCHNTAATTIDNDVFFITRSKRQMRAAAFDITADSYLTPDQAVFSEHLAKRGMNRVVYQAEPDGVIWIPCEDGSLLGTTILKAQDVNAWHQHSIGGRLGAEPAVVEDVAVIPSPFGDIDDLWMVVRRTINGVQVRHIEYLADPYSPTGSQDRDGMNFLDASLSVFDASDNIFTLSGGTSWESQDTGILTSDGSHFSNPGERIRLRSRDFGGNLKFVTVRVDNVQSAMIADVTFLQEVPEILQNFPADEAYLEIAGVNGLTHLIGETVGVVVDGAPHPDRVVDGAGGFDLQSPAFEVRAGLKYTSRIKSLFFSPQNEQGDTQATKKRISSVRVDLLASNGLKIGTTFDDELTQLDDLVQRETDDNMDLPPDLVSGIRQLPVRSRHGFKVQVVLEQDNALPFTLRAFIPRQETYS